MNKAPVHPVSRSGLVRRQVSAPAVAALLAAMLALNASTDLKAADGTFQANPGDQGSMTSFSSDGSTGWTVSPALSEGDAVRVVATGYGVNADTYYYVVGVGSTAGGNVRLAQHPGGVGNVTANATGNTTITTTPFKVPNWYTAGNWVGGVVPNGVDAQATIATIAGTPALAVDRDTTLGALEVNTANGPLSLIATARNDGPVSRLKFQRTSGTPTITVLPGNTFSLSESKTNGTSTPTTVNAKLFIAGDQGLVIDNQNPVPTPIANNVSTVGNYSAGAVRFGNGLNWTYFTGDLTLVKGVFQPLAGGGGNTGITSFPMRSKLVLGTGTNTARVEIAHNNAQTAVGGLESTSPNSSIINTTGGTSTVIFQVGGLSSATDTFNYKGNIGDTSTGLSSASGVRITKVGLGTQILSGVNNLNALSANQIMVAVNDGKLSLGTTGALGTVTPELQGTLNGNSSINLKNAEFEISGANVSTPRSQTFAGPLALSGLDARFISDNNATWQANGFDTITVIADANQPASLAFGSTKRNSGSGNNRNLNGVTVLYRGSNLGSGPGAGNATITFTTAPSVGTSGYLNSVSGGGTLGSPTAPVLKGSLADTSPTGHGLGFATYDSTNNNTIGVRLLNPSTEQTTVTTGAAYDAADAGGEQNVVLNVSSADAAITGKRSNTLQISNSGGVSRTVTNTGTALNPANGLLFSGNSSVTLTGGEIIGSAASDGEDVVIHSINSSTGGVTVQTAITNVGSAGSQQGWITYNGFGNITVAGTQTVGAGGGIAFNGTGTTTLASTISGASILAFNQGVVKLAPGATWTNNPTVLLAGPAKLDLNGVGGNSTTNRFIDLQSSYGAGVLTMNPAGGEITNSASGNPVDLVLSGNSTTTATLPFFGKISGNLNLVIDKTATGTQTFGAAHTYTGSTTIKSGSLILTRYASLPSTTEVTFGSDGGTANSTLLLSDTVTNANVPVRLEIAGLKLSGNYTGVGSVQNNSTNMAQLTLNVPVSNTFAGNLGIAQTATGVNANLFGLRKKGAGVFEATGTITNYSGGTIIEEGILRVSSDSKLGLVGPLGGSTGASGTTSLLAAPLSPVANQIILNGGTLNAATTADFVLSPLRGIGLGPVTGTTGGTGTLLVDAGVKLTYAGIIASAGNTGSNTLVKSGDGALILDGANTFTGVTQVSAGSLGGNGSLASGVTVASGAALAPGNTTVGIGTFTINGALTLNGGSILKMDLGTAGNPGSSDKIQLGGALSASGTTTVNFTDAGGFGVGTYTLISGTAPISPSNFAVGTIPSGFRGTFGSVGNTLTVTIAVGSQLTALESWRESNFGNSANSGNGADSADPDADGLSNLLEYATGSNPNVSTASAVSVARSGNFLTLTYTRIADTSLTYTVEGSSDLATWSTVATSTGAQNVAGPVTVTDNVSLTSRRFLRLKVSY